MEPTGQIRTKRKKPSYLQAIISISLVLFVIGILGATVLQVNKKANEILENTVLQLELSESTSEADINLLKSELLTKPYIKTINFITAEEALAQEEETWGAVDIGYNPLYDAFEINLHAEWVNPDSIAVIKEELTAEAHILQVHYREVLISNLSRNIKKLLLIILVAALVLIVISIILIDSTIRLAMFSNRFLIRSMQLVGASRWFVIKPFMSTALLNGFISGLIANIAIVAVAYLIEQQNPGIRLLEDYLNFGVVLGGVLLLGILISWLSTYRAVSKYLRMKLDDLY